MILISRDIKTIVALLIIVLFELTYLVNDPLIFYSEVLLVIVLSSVEETRGKTHSEPFEWLEWPGMVGNGSECPNGFFPIEQKTLILLKKKVIINGVATRLTAGAERRRRTTRR